MKGYQQGDFLLISTDAIPDGAVCVPHAPRGCVVAEGEATGHAHVLDPATSEQFTAGGEYYVRVNEPNPLTHEEHDTQIIAPGVYRVGGVVEKDWLEDVTRRVVD